MKPLKLCLLILGIAAFVLLSGTQGWVPQARAEAAGETPPVGGCPRGGGGGALAEGTTTVTNADGSITVTTVEPVGSVGEQGVTETTFPEGISPVTGLPAGGSSGGDLPPPGSDGAAMFNAQGAPPPDEGDFGA